MSPATRSRSRRGEGDRLRGEILAAAEGLLIETADESAVSLRAIADRVGVTPPSIYRHFTDKDELLLSVCSDVFGRLDEALEAAATGASDPFDELIRKGNAYVGFGLAHPEHYRLLFMIKKSVMHENPKEGILDSPAIPGSSAFGHLMDTVERALAAADPGTSRPDPFVMTCSVWTAVHGITSLRIALPRFPWPPIDDQIEQVVTPWRAALRPSSLNGRPARTMRPSRRSSRR